MLGKHRRNRIPDASKVRIPTLEMRVGLVEGGVLKLGLSLSQRWRQLVQRSIACTILQRRSSFRRI